MPGCQDSELMVRPWAPNTMEWQAVQEQQAFEPPFRTLYRSADLHLRLTSWQFHLSGQRWRKMVILLQQTLGKQHQEEGA